MFAVSIVFMNRFELREFVMVLSNPGCRRRWQEDERLVFGLENTHTGKIKSMRKRENGGRYEVSG